MARELLEAHDAIVIEGYYLLHALEKLPVPDFVWEVENWRARFCCWAVDMRPHLLLHIASY